MGMPGIPRPVRFFASLISQGPDEMDKAESDLVGLLGEVKEKTATAAFIHTAYYEKEMGEGLSRRFLLFEPLQPRDRLPSVKLDTNRIETAMSMGGKRRVNIDPGYVSLEQMVLATTKGYAHRLYLGHGIYGDLTLMYVNGSFQPMAWTYPDYASEELVSMFNRWRNDYKTALRNSTPGKDAPKKS
jgi:hypothetical protein